MRRALQSSSRVLVRIPSWLGDCVAIEPILRALHGERAHAERLTIAGPERLLALFDGRFPGARRIRGDDARAWRGHDVALVLNGSWRSAWAAFRAGIPERSGFLRSGRSALFTHGFEPAKERGATPLGLGIAGRGQRVLPRPFGAACIELAALLGLEVRDRAPRLEPLPLAVDAARARLQKHGVAHRFVLVHAGARPDSAKAFPAASWRGVLARIERSSGVPVVVVCAPGEEANAREAMRASKALLFDDPAPDLQSVVALTSLASVVLTADSGPRHVARALGVPCAVACGPTDPRHSAEHASSVRIARVDVPCGPCHRETCRLHGASRHACMLRIDVDAFADIALELLAARERG